MDNSQYIFSGNNSASEINTLLSTFWGHDSPVSHYQEQSIVSFEKAFHEANRAHYNRQDLLTLFGGKTVTMGLRYKNKLIAHSALLIQPWGDVETAGSIIDPEFRGKSLMKIINEKKKELLNSIKHKSEYRKGNLFHIDDQENGFMYIFDENAECIESRPLRPNERQGRIKQIYKDGTNG